MNAANQELTLEELGNIQQLVNGIVQKLGANKAVALLESIYHHQQTGASELQRERLLIDFIKAKAIVVFNLREEHLYDSNIIEYRDARMACYHLLKTHTTLSYPMIGQLFRQKKRSVMHYYHKAEAFIQAPAYYQSFYKKYQQLHNNLLDFITTLNTLPHG